MPELPFEILLSLRIWGIPEPLAIYLIWAIPISLTTVIVYWWDKRQATKENSRVKETTLHGLALLGGWPGTIFAQRKFRHKTRKVTFQIMTWSIVLAHIGFWVIWFTWVHDRI